MKRECISLKKGSIWIWTNTIEKQLEGEKGSGLLAAEKARISSLMGKELLGQMLLEQYGIDLSRERNLLGKNGRGNLSSFTIRRFILISVIRKIWCLVGWEIFP